MIGELLENRLLAAALVVIAVPFVLVGYILFVEWNIRRAPRRAADGRRPCVWHAPALVCLGVFLVYPTFATIGRSLMNRKGDEFVGLANFEWFFTQDSTLTALRNNALWVILLPLFVVGIGLFIAVLVDRVRYEGGVKTVVFLPMAISFVAAGTIWKFLYDLDPNVGTFNAVVTKLGADPIAYTVIQPWNNFFLILVGVWLLTGFAMVILSAGLKGISVELLEAARVDGATELQIFRRVIWPLLLPTVAVVATTIVIYALKTFDVVYTMTNGNFNTDVIANNMFTQLYSNLRPERAAAVAVVLLIAIIPLMFINVRRFRQQEAIR